MNTTKLSELTKTAKKEIVKRSPEILTGIGIAAAFATTVLAVKATPKALRLIEERKEEDEELPVVEVVKTTWKCYIPAAVSGSLSIACLVGAQSVNARRNAAAIAAYKLYETTLSEYKEKAVEMLGEKKEKTIHDKISKDKMESNPVSKNEVIVTEKGNTLCYDQLSGRYFRSDIDKMKKALNEIDKRMMRDGYISLNELYDELGLSHTALGYELGWKFNGELLGYYFSSQIADDDTPCIVLNFDNPPVYDYSKYV